MTSKYLDFNLFLQSDQINEGIYYFGGKNAQGELNNQMKYMATKTFNNKLVSVEWQKLKFTGLPPCARFGHCMTYLPIT